MVRGRGKRWQLVGKGDGQVGGSHGCEEGRKGLKFMAAVLAVAEKVRIAATARA